jgi:hypothetical protein
MTFESAHEGWQLQEGRESFQTTANINKEKRV